MGNTSQKQTNQQTTQQSSYNPWAPAVGQLTGTALPGLSNAYNASTAGNAATRPTDFTAGLVPGQVQNFQDMLTQGQNTGAVTPIINQGAGIFGGGSAGAFNALGSLLGFDPTSLLNPGAISSGANQYVAGANIPAQVAQAMQSGIETARDIGIPGVESAAAGGGNTNSSRTGVAEGIIGRGLAEQAGNLSGALSGTTYSNALNTALQGGSTIGNQILSALTSAGGLGSTLLGQGAGAVGSGISSLGQLLGLGATGGAGLQQGAQDILTNKLQQNQFATQNPFSSISQYLPLLAGIAGLGGQGSQTGTSNTTERTTPSAMATIGQLMSAGGSLLGGQGPFGATGLGGISGVTGLIGNLLKPNMNGTPWGN